jgi:hypothetical protein
LRPALVRVPASWYVWWVPTTDTRTIGKESTAGETNAGKCCNIIGPSNQKITHKCPPLVGARNEHKRNKKNPPPIDAFLCMQFSRERASHFSHISSTRKHIKTKMEEPYCTVCLAATAAVSILAINFIVKKLSGSFERNAVDNSFSNPLIGSVSLLSNNDSVLSREGVKDSIEGYEKLFSGARKEIGATTSKESVNLREKEYRTMVNSFYDLVTDFYEWGWGQVRTKNGTILPTVCYYRNLSQDLLYLTIYSILCVIALVGHVLRHSLFISLLASKVKLSTSLFIALSTTWLFELDWTPRKRCSMWAVV